MARITPRLLIHGGAWSLPLDMVEASIQGAREAAKRGLEVLSKNGSATDAVEAAIVILEDNTVFNAGFGSSLTRDGTVECDASIASCDHRAGACACLSGVKNPIRLARKIMENTDHVLVVGRGAESLAKEFGLDLAPGDMLVSPSAREELRRFNRDYKASVAALMNDRAEIAHAFGHDTVGAVALDASGNLAAGTSTGGIVGKVPGRVGDAPVLGAGTFVRRGVGAVSCTGHGEGILKYCLAKSTLDHAARDLDLGTAMSRALVGMKAESGSRAGMIGIAADGSMVTRWNTRRMVWAGGALTHMMQLPAHVRSGVGDHGDDPFDSL